MPATSRRRWLTFGLIAFAVVACTGGYVFREWQIVQERRAVLREARESGFRGRCYILFVDKKKAPFSLRRLMGDTIMHSCYYPTPAPEDLVARLKRAFPEAAIESDLDRLIAQLPAPEQQSYRKAFEFHHPPAPAEGFEGP